jgi:membrane associated rhomboid family serine protease
MEACQTGVVLVGVMLLITTLDTFLPTDLRYLGIVPRTGFGLVGVLFGPLIHLSYAHLFANAIPLLILLILLFADRKYGPNWTLAWIWVGSGLGTWLIGRGHAVHIGASGLVYGLAAYLLAAGWWMRSWRSIIIAAVVLLLYWNLFFGMLPQHGMISWEGHLAGAIAGLLVAFRRHG